jgi:Transcriptional regulators
MKGQVSQRDLARLAGVSPMTVSLALRGHPSISPATRARIVKLAEQQRYRPDPALAALNAYRIRQAPARFHGTLAWVTNFPERDGWRGMIQATGYFDGAAARADQLGYRLEEFWLAEPGLNAKRASQILLARGIRGLIIAPLPTPRGALELEWRHFSSVALGYSLSSPKLHVIMNNQFRNMKHVVQTLHERGHRRIGLAMPSANDERVDHNYLGGYWIAQRDFPKDAARLEPLLAPDLDKKAFVSWYRRSKPDAVVVAASMSHLVIEWLNELGARVPEDVSVAVASVPYKDTTISGVDEGVPSIGAQAVEAVVGMIHRNEQGVPARPFSLLLEGVWTEGRTAGRRTAAGRPAGQAVARTPASSRRRTSRSASPQP